MMMMYGYAPTSLDDPVIRLAEEGTKLLAALTGFGGTLINIFPILRYFPPYRKVVKRFQEVTEKTKRMPMDHAKAALVKKNAPPILHYMAEMFIQFVATGDCGTITCDRVPREESDHWSFI